MPNLFSRSSSAVFARSRRDVRTDPSLKHVAVLLGGEVSGVAATWPLLLDLVTHARRLGLQCLTLGRWRLLGADGHEHQRVLSTLSHSVEALRREDVRVVVLGGTDEIPTQLRRDLEPCIEQTAGGTGMTLVLDIDAANQAHVVRSARELAALVRAGLVLPEEIDESSLRRTLGTPELPEVDLLIYSSGSRLLDLLMFDSPATLARPVPLGWPTFRLADFDAAIGRPAP